MNPQFNDEFNEAVKNIGLTGDAYAIAKSKSWLLQELKGSMLAQLMRETGSEKISRSEMIARSSTQYRDFLDGVSEAIKQELLAKGQYERSRAEFEKLRSLCSLEKSTQKEIGI